MGDTSTPLPLDDARWSALRHAYGPAGDVPALIEALARGDDRRQPADLRDGVWHRVWSALCHQGDVYSATFAALPHIVAIGATRPRGEQLAFWSFAAAVALAEPAASVPQDLAEAYRAAIARARADVVHCVVPGVEDYEGRWSLVAVAGLRERREVADALEGLAMDEIAPECPGCGTQLYVTTIDLPFVVSVEDPVRSAPTRTTSPVRMEPRPALMELVELARRAELEALAQKVAALECVVTCPSCGAQLHLLGDPT